MGTRQTRLMSPTGPIGRCVCLNVDKRYAEQPRIREEFGRVGISVEFFLAGDGKSVDAPYDRIDEEPPPGREGSYPAFLKRPNSWNAFQSFRAIIKKADEDGIHTLLLLEDDAYPTHDFLDVFPKAWSRLHSLDPEWELLALGANHTFCPTQPVGTHLLRMNGSGCWHGILLHRRVFPLVLALEPTNPIDYVVSKQIHPRGHSYAAWPNIVWVRPGFSECEARYVSYEEFRENRGC